MLMGNALPVQPKNWWHHGVVWNSDIKYWRFIMRLILWLYSISVLFFLYFSSFFLFLNPFICTSGLQYGFRIVSQLIFNKFELSEMRFLTFTEQLMNNLNLTNSIFPTFRWDLIWFMDKSHIVQFTFWKISLRNSFGWSQQVK